MDTRKDKSNKDLRNCYSLDQSLDNIRIPFLFSGLNISSKRSCLQNLIFLTNFLWLYLNLIFGMYWIVDGLVNGETFTVLTFLAPCMLCSILASFKVLFFLLNEERIKELLDKMIEVVNDHDLTETEKEIIQPDIKFLNYLIKVLNTMNCMLVVFYDPIPICVIVYKYIMKSEVVLYLPFYDFYPFDTSDFTLWLLAYIHQVGSEVITLVQVCATDYLLFTCCTHINIQFKLLQYHIERLIPTTIIETRLYNSEVQAELSRLIKWHQEIISLANMLEYVYTYGTMLNFTFSSLIICLTGFNLSNIDEIPLKIMSLIFLSMSLSQIFFLCLFGDILMQSSLDVTDAVYKCKWYLSDASFGKTMLIIQRRAQSPCKLTAAGFADVNLMSFMRILSTSWSYFALLQTMYGARSD